MTGYYLELGYNSSLGDPQLAHAWGTLLAVFDNIIRDPARVVKEVLRIESGSDEPTLREYVEWYTSPDRPSSDLTYQIKYHEEPPQKGYITQYASSGDGLRATKESVRRAVCRLVIEDMHRLKLEVNLRVS